MSRQITLGRTELGLSALNLQDPTNGYYVSDVWQPGGIQWQRYNAAGSALANGDRVVGQRKVGVDEIFQVYVHAATPSGIKAKVQTIIDALSQFRYTLTITWDGATYNYQANGAGEVRYMDDAIDPVLFQAGWVGLEITIPRDPGNG